MPGVSEEQVNQARSVDLLEWFMSHEPLSVKKCGADEYCLKEHDSFKMSNGRWHWFSQGFGGYSALDYLVKVRGVGFVEAVLSLSDGAALSPHKERFKPKANAPPKPAKPFALPPANVNNDRVYAYLRGRGIGKDVINRCFKAGILYESKAHRCVFVGMEGGVPRSAFERGTDDNFKRDVAGSVKRFGFVLPPEKPEGSHNLAVFESAVDSLAHHEIHRAGQIGWDGYRLALGGVGQAALTCFLEGHTDITSVQLCLDNDLPGQEAAVRIIKGLLADKRFSGLRITAAPPPAGKDYADTLSAIREFNKAQARPDRHQAVF